MDRNHSRVNVFQRVVSRVNTAKRRCDASRRKRLRRCRLFEALESRQLLASDLGLVDTALAYGGIADASVSSTNSGLVVAIDTAAGIVAPLHNDHLTDDWGVSGVSFSANGRLWYALSDASGSVSVLQQIDPGRAVAIGQPLTLSIRVLDLATDLRDDTLYAIGYSGGTIASQTSLYRIDLNTGVATPTGHLDATGAAAFAIDEHGMGFVVAADPTDGSPWLLEVNPSDGSIHRQRGLHGDSDFSGQISGLGVRGDGMLVAADADNGNLLKIDALTGQVFAIASQAPIHGILGDIAFAPSAIDLCALDQVYREDFNQDDGQFTIDNTGRTISGLWHRTAGRRFDHLLNHSPQNSFYYGGFETAFGNGNYVLTQSHRGTIVSPQIELPASGTTIVSFSYLLDTRLPLDTDFVRVSILVDGVATQILSRQDGSLPQTSVRKWLSATHDISQFNGQTIQIEFLFDTGDVPQVDPEGWYVDDIEIINIPAPRIQGYKWNDLNADGLWQADEPGLNGRTIYIDQNNNQSLDADEAFFITRNDGDHDGAYWFNCLPDGDYVLREVVPDDSLATYPVDARGQAAAHQVNLESDAVLSGAFGVAQTLNFGNSHIDVLGYKWNDLNADGLWNDDEPGLNGWTIYADANDNGVLDVGERSADTSTRDGKDGVYVLAGLGDGQHTLREVAQDGWRQTYPQASPSAADSNDTSSNDSSGNDTLSDDRSAHRVTIDSVGNALVIGNFLDAASPNFGNHFVRPADLTITKTASVSEASAGDVVIFTIQAANIASLDSDVARAVQVTDVLPQGLKLVASAAPSVGNVTTQVDQSNGRTTILWDGFDLPAGESAHLTFAVQIDASVGSTTMTNVASGHHEGDELDPSNNDGSNEQGRWQIDVAAVVQFSLPLDVIRSGPAQYVAPAANDGPSISGYKWADLNRNGVWDVGEPGQSGYVFYIDSDNDGHQDFDETTDDDHDGKLDVAEPFAITDADGRYVFTSLTDGTSLSDGDYTIGESSVGLAAGIQVRTFPLGPGGQTVTIDGGQSVGGDVHETNAPNFGGYAYAPYVRPADDVAGHLNAWSDDPGLSQSNLSASIAAALAPWQTVSISNATGDELMIQGIDLSQLSAQVRKYISLRTADGTADIAFDRETGQLEQAHRLAGVDDPLTDDDETTWQVSVYFNPAWSDASGDQREDDNGQQSPDWRGGQITEAVDFRDTDTLVFTTESEARFRVKLFGGSTFDSDITYSGSVNFSDVVLFNEVFNGAPVTATQPGFDFTKDINVRYTNGADGHLSGTTWPIEDITQREIGLGDYGPLNVELLYVRPVWIDLDADNSSGKLGTGNQTLFTNAPVNVADADATIATDDNVLLELLHIRLAGDTLASDRLSAAPDSAGGELTFENLTVADAAQILRSLTFTTDDRSQFRNVEVIVEAVVAESTFQKTPLSSVASRTSSAVARVLVAPQS